MSDVRFKVAPAEFKADDGAGEFEALVSVFGNVDKSNEVVHPGAFERQLKERGVPPIVWSHLWGIPPIGEGLAAEETEKGLAVRGRLFTAKDEDHPIARQVWAGMKSGAIKEFSFSYEYGKVEEDDDGVLHLKEIFPVFEVGPCLVGANPSTELLSVKTVWTPDDVGNLYALLTLRGYGKGEEQQSAANAASSSSVAVTTVTSTTAPPAEDAWAADPSAVSEIMTAMPLA